MMQVYTNTQHPICQDLKIKLNLSGGPLWDLQSQGSGLSRPQASLVLQDSNFSHWVSVACPCPAYIRTGHMSRAETAPCKTGFCARPETHLHCFQQALSCNPGSGWFIVTVSLTELELLRNYCTPLVKRATMFPERFNRGGTGLGSIVP